MTREDFLKIAEYGNENWKGCFTEEEIQQNADDYYAEWVESDKQGKATHVIEELCKLLIEDGGKQAEEFLEEISFDAFWGLEVYYCQGCDKREIVFFTEEELENLYSYQNGNPKRMLIQNVLPNCSPMVREYIRTEELCLCEECWDRYWSGELTIE